MSELLNFILDHEDAFKSKARLASLYSDFARLKTTNPDGYRANIHAWSSALMHASQSGVGIACGVNRLSIQAGAHLEKELESKSVGRPVALAAVIDETVKEGDLIPLSDFLQSKSSIYRKPGWIPEFHIPSAWQIAQWGLRQVGYGGGAKLVEGDYVIKANVEAASRQVLQQLSNHIHMSTPTSQVYSLETFNHTFSRRIGSMNTFSTTDIRILLTHLSRDLKACTISWPSPESGLTTIKFSVPGAASLPSAITAQDLTLSQLSTLQLALADQTHALNSRLNMLEGSIRQSVADSSKNLASKERTLGLLRTRKALTTTLVKRETSLHQIESVLQSIDDAATQVDMVRAMQDSSAVLRDLNKQTGGAEAVGTVMNNLRDEMEGVDEVAKVLAEAGPDVDEGEVEDELEGLIQEAKSKEEKAVAEVRANVEAQRRREEESATQKLAETMPAAPQTGFGPIERRRRREEEAEMEKRLSSMSLEEVPTSDPAPHIAQQ